MMFRLMMLRRRTTIALAVLAATTISAAGACLAAELSAMPPPPLLHVYQLDPAETRSRFEVKFMGLITVRGKFNRTSGTLWRDPQLRDSSIHAIIDTTTLEANLINAGATNRVLRGREFFQVEKFPTIDFRSYLFVYDGERLLRIEGTLTLLGVTRPVTLSVASSRCVAADAARRARCEANAAVTVKRSDFGMLGWSESVGDEVKIIVELVAVEAAPEQPAPDLERAPTLVRAPLSMP